MINGETRETRIDAVDFISASEPAINIIEKNENQETAVSETLNVKATTQRDVSAIFSRLKKSARKKSVSIF